MNKVIVQEINEVYLNFVYELVTMKAQTFEYLIFNNKKDFCFIMKYQKNWE